MRKPATRGVLFDLYGTLLVYGDMDRAWADWRAGFYKLMKKRGLAMDRPEFERRLAGFFSHPAPRSGGGRLTPYERKIRSLGMEAGISLNRGALREIADKSIAVWQRHIPPDPGARPLIEKLVCAGKKIALITNFDHPPHVHSLLKRMRVARHLSAVMVSGAVGVRKPDPGIFRLALKTLGLAPREAVHVGDSPEDVAGARNAGIRPVLIRRPGAAFRRAPAGVRTIARLAELPGLLKGCAIVEHS